MVEGDGDCPLMFIEEHLGHLGVDDDVKVFERLHAVSGVPNEGLGSRASGSSTNVALRYGKTCLSGAVYINIGITKHFGRLQESTANRCCVMSC